MRRSLVVLAIVVLLASPFGIALAVGGALPPKEDARTAGLPAGNTTLNLHVTPTSAQVSINGTTVALGGDGSTAVHLVPGTYTVVATSAGFTTFSGNVTLTAGETKFLTIHLPAQATGSSGPGGPSPTFLLAIAATVAGAIAVVVLVLYVRRASAPDPEPPSGTPPAAPRGDEGPP